MAFFQLSTLVTVCLSSDMGEANHYQFKVIIYILIWVQSRLFHSTYAPFRYFTSRFYTACDEYHTFFSFVCIIYGYTIVPVLCYEKRASRYVTVEYSNIVIAGWMIYNVLIRCPGSHALPIYPYSYIVRLRSTTLTRSQPKQHLSYFMGNRYLILDPFTSNGVTLILPWISNYIHHEVLNEKNLSIPKLQRMDRCRQDKYFCPTIYWACDYLSMMGLKLNPVGKKRCWNQWITSVGSMNFGINGRDSLGQIVKCSSLYDKYASL